MVLEDLSSLEKVFFSRPESPEMTKIHNLAPCKPSLMTNSSTSSGASPRHTLSSNSGPSIIEDGFYSNSSATNCGHMSIVSLAVISIICLLLIFFKSYVKDMLTWLEHTDALVRYLAFLFMYTLVSFPIAWGYFLLLLTTGYVYGFLHGIFVVLSCGAVGVSTAYLFLRICCRCITVRFYSKKLEAVIKVVEGPQGYKVIALARLTPIPFGLQNGLFGLTQVSMPVYSIASVVGMMPLALVNCYVGSTFRSMEEVWNNSSSHITGYLVFCGQLLLMVCLMTFVIRKARRELHKTVLSQSMDTSNCFCERRLSMSLSEEASFGNTLLSDSTYVSIPCSVCLNSAKINSMVFTA
ncbi:transmembrane protein 64-like [Argonauta hians]